MKEALDKFVNYLGVEKSYSSHTLRNYRSDIQQYIDSEKIVTVEDISKDNIRFFLGSLYNKQISPKTRNRKLASVRSFCKFLCDERLLEFNPSSDIQCAKVEKKLPVFFTKSETFQVIDSADSVRDKAMLETLYGLGVRVSELVNMKVRDLDFINLSARVLGKGQKERVVPMNEPAAEAILAYLREKGSIEPNDYIFGSPVKEGEHITSRAAYDVVAKYGKRSNLEGLSPHKFRHSYATHLHSNGLDIRDIQELLGHADISTTTIYTRVVMENLSKNFRSAHPRG